MSTLDELLDAYADAVAKRVTLEDAPARGVDIQLARVEEDNARRMIRVRHHRGRWIRGRTKGRRIAYR